MRDYVAHIKEDKPGHFRIWSESAETRPDRYVGPVADVYGDQEWVCVVTDKYEGYAMVNRTTLPKLIEALTRLEAHLTACANARDD